MENKITELTAAEPEEDAKPQVTLDVMTSTSLKGVVEVVVGLDLDDSRKSQLE